MTQKYVAECLGVAPTTVYWWTANRAKPTMEHLVALERLLDCWPGELLIATAYGDPRLDLY